MRHRPVVTLPAVLVALAISASAARAVNLVPNPSFETVSPCPTGFGQLNVAVPWDTPNTGTSDALHACAPSGPFAPGVPFNALGQQAAFSGVGYAGLIPYSSAADYREYLYAPLNSPLVAAQTYTFSFHVSLADTSMLAIDRLGAYFSVGPIGPYGNYAPLPFTPQVESPANAFLTNTTGWTTISGSFVAVGGEDHIVIGNFHDDATTNTTPMPGTWPGGAYYYVDDVTVEIVLPTDQACCLADGSCAVMLPGECQALGGTPGGAGSVCDPSPCGPTPAKRTSWGAVKTIYR